MANAAIYIELQNRTSADLKRIEADLKAADREADKARAALDAYRRSELATAKAGGDLAKAQQIVNSITADATKGTISYNKALTEQARLDNQIAKKAAGSGGRFAGVGDDLVGMAAGALTVGAALQVVKSGIDAIANANQLKASIDQTNASLALQVRSVRSQTEVFAQAREYGDRYKITQQELAPALLASTAIFRSSNASVAEVLGTLQRLQQLSPEQGLDGAALALKELQSGSTLSLVERFEVSRSKANEMKNAIQAGADATKVLSDYLSQSGVGMEALDLRTQGALGEMNALKKEQEDFQLSLAKATEKPYAFVLQFASNELKFGDRLLSGDAQEVAKRQIKDIFGVDLRSDNPLLNFLGNDLAAIPTLAAANFAGVGGTKEYYDQIALERKNAANIDILEEKRDLRSATGGEQPTKAAADAQADATRKTYDNATSKLVNAANAATLADRERELKRDIDLAATGIIGQAEKVEALRTKYNLATADAQLLVDQQRKIINDGALSDQRAGERSGGQFNSVAEANQAATVARNRAARARELQDAQLQYARTTGDTVAVQGILNQRLAEARGNTVDELKIKGELYQLQQTTNKEGLRENKTIEDRLRLEERIYDAKNKQRDAALNAQLASVENRTKTREEERALAIAQRVLASGSASTEQKAAAQEEIERVALDRQKRLNDITKQQAEANGQIIDGQIYASRQRPGTTVGGRPVPTAIGSPALNATPATTTPTSGTSAGGSGIVVQVVIDGQIAGKAILPYVVSSLRSGLEQAQAAGV